MQELMKRLKKDYQTKQNLILFLFLILIIGLSFGAFFITILDKPDQTILFQHIQDFFTQLKDNTIDYKLVLRNSLASNLLYVFLIWILGISIMGIPLIILLVFLKGFIIGFSITSIIAKYKLIGLLGAFTYIFPHLIIMALVLIYLSVYALNLSFELVKALLKRKEMNFRNVINRYSLVMLISIIIVIITALIETYISPYFIKFFLFFLKL